MSQVREPSFVDGGKWCWQMQYLLSSRYLHAASSVYIWLPYKSQMKSVAILGHWKMAEAVIGNWNEVASHTSSELGEGSFPFSN